MSLLETPLDDTLAMIVERDGLDWFELARAAHRGIRRNHGRHALERLLTPCARRAAEDVARDRRSWGR